MTQIAIDILNYLESNPEYHSSKEVFKALPNYKPHDIIVEMWDLMANGRVKLGDMWDVKATFKHESWF